MGKGLHLVGYILLVIGGLNWLLVGLFQWDIGSLFGGVDAMISRVIYVLIGAGAVYNFAMHKKHCRECNPGGSGGAAPSGSTGGGM